LALRVLGLVTVPSPSSELLLEREDLGSSLLCDALAMVFTCNSCGANCVRKGNSNRS
jgi:hypothetical protein